MLPSDIARRAVTQLAHMKPAETRRMRVARRHGGCDVEGMLARTFAAFVPLALVALASFDCGGKTDVTPVTNDCDSLQNGQTTCSTEGETCAAPMQSACVGAPTLYCTCEGGQFDCPAPPPTCPEPACPPPDQVTPGGPCNGFMVCDTNQTVTDCDGNTVGVVQCQCAMGSFGECTSPPAPVCTFDAGMADASK